MQKEAAPKMTTSRTLPTRARSFSPVLFPGTRPSWFHSTCVARRGTREVMQKDKNLKKTRHAVQREHEIEAQARLVKANPYKYGLLDLKKQDVYARGNATRRRDAAATTAKLSATRPKTVKFSS